MINKSAAVKVLLMLIMIWPQVAWTDTLGDGILSGYRVTAGIRLESVDFDVYLRDQTDPSGTFSEDFTYSPIFRLGSPYNYFGDSSWGGVMEYSFSTFNLNRQLVSNELVDLDTSVKGYYAFVTPALFYAFHLSHREKAEVLVVGLGVGLGYLDASGDIRFTETTQELHDFDISGSALAISLFVDYRLGDFTSRLSGGLTSHASSGYDYDSFGFAWELSYVFDL